MAGPKNSELDRPGRRKYLRIKQRSQTSKIISKKIPKGLEGFIEYSIEYGVKPSIYSPSLLPHLSDPGAREVSE